MKKSIPLLIKEYAYFAVAAILLFTLLSPSGMWDMVFPGFIYFDYLVFAVIASLFMIVCAADLAIEKQSFFKPFRENIWLICYLAALIIAVAASVNPRLSCEFLPRYLSGLLMVYIIRSSELTYEKIRRIFGFLALGLAVAASYAILQRIWGIEPSKSFTDLAANPNMPGRVDSFFGNPSVFGFALSALLPVSAAYVFCEKSRLRAALGSTAFILGVTALIMTYSRGPWFASFVGIFVFAALSKPKLIPVLLLLGLAAFPFIPITVKNRILSAFNPNETSIGYRGLLVGSGLKAIADNPIFGVGPGTGVVQAFVLSNYWPPELAYRFTHSHNLFVQTWCELGIFGFVTFFGAVLHNIINAVRNFRKQSIASRVLSASLISGMTAMLLCGIADYTFSYSRIMLLFWILFGLLQSAAKLDTEQRS